METELICPKCGKYATVEKMINVRRDREKNPEEGYITICRNCTLRTKGYTTEALAAEAWRRKLYSPLTRMIQKDLTDPNEDGMIALVTAIYDLAVSDYAAAMKIEVKANPKKNFSEKMVRDKKNGIYKECEELFCHGYYLNGEKPGKRGIELLRERARKELKGSKEAV